MPTILPGTSLGRAEYDRLDALIALYRSAVRDLSETERGLNAGTYRRRYMRARIREASEITARLLAYRDGVAVGAVADWARENLPATYQYGAGLAVRDLQAQTVAAIGGSPRIHTRAVASLVDRFLSDSTQIVAQLHANTIRASRVILEQAGFTGEIAQGIIGGIPRRQVSRQLVRALNSRVSGAVGAEINLTLVQIGGRNYSVDTWAEMYARTEMARASTAGTRVLSAVNGVRHIQITSHAHEPCICTPFEGRIYALEQGDSEFEHVSVLPGGGTPLHPNCVHREAPAVIDILRERGEVEGRTRIPGDFVGLDESELARLVRANRGQLRRYSMQRSGYLPEGFTLRQRRAA